MSSGPDGTTLPEDRPSWGVHPLQGQRNVLAQLCVHGCQRTGARRTHAPGPVSPIALTSSSNANRPELPTRPARGREEGAEGVRHAGSEACNTDQVGAAAQAKSKAVGPQLVGVVVVPKEVGGFGSADRSDLIAVRYEGLIRGVTIPPADVLLAPALTEVGSGSSGS
jgi:hypothetical protein